MKAMNYPQLIVRATNEFMESIPNIDAKKVEPEINAVNKYNTGPGNETVSKEGFVRMDGKEI